MYNLLIIVGFLILGGSFLLQGFLKKKFDQYVNLPASMTGREVSEFLLRYNNITNVSIGKGEGTLTDFYDSVSKHINLSPDVYDTHSIAAMAVAAHETGHAIQDATHYSPLIIRSLTYPIVNIASNIVPFIMGGGMLFGLGGNSALGTNILFIGIIAYLVLAFFSLITLPVEFNASARAISNLKSSGLLNDSTQEKNAVLDLLFWAGMTYVLNAISSVVELLKLVSLYNSRRD